jgi:class 3 adenylate cyclase
MAPERVQSNWNTIFAADVERYWRLMRADEEVTLRSFGEYHEIINALIFRHDGRLSQGFPLGSSHPVGELRLGTASTATEQRCRVDTADQRTGRTRCWQY